MDEGVICAALFFMEAAGAGAGFAADVHRVFSLRHQSREGRRREMLRNFLMTFGASGRPEEGRAGNLRRFKGGPLNRRAGNHDNRGDQTGHCD